MTTVSRRNFVKALAALPLTLALPRVARANTYLVRYDIASPKGREMLEVYAHAVRQMQAMGPANPMSWMWQWYTHFVDGTTSKSSELDRIFGTGDSPQKTLASEVWNTCQSHAGQNSNHFLPWHRMFVYYFERIVRQVSGRPDFTLPYWDYTSDDPAKRGIVPEQFRLPDDPVYDCLYRPNRSTLANAGEPIHKNQPTDVMDITEVMRKTHYSTVDSVMGFCRAVDSSIHGRIHVLVGNGSNMGAVPYAGADPLFWVHHVNIDRIWASWNKNGNRNPDPMSTPWAGNYFPMVDENGERVYRPLRSFFSALALGYDYDSFIPPPPAAKLLPAGQPGSKARKVAAARKAAELGVQAVPVLLEPLEKQRHADVLGLDDRDPDKRAYLVLRDLHTWSQPETLFHVYLGPGAGRTPLDKTHYVGDINFFDAEFHDHGNAKLDEALGENFYSFDVTGILEAMRRGKAPARDRLLVTIVPAGRPAGGQPMVGTIELVRQ